MEVSGQQAALVPFSDGSRCVSIIVAQFFRRALAQIDSSGAIRSEILAQKPWRRRFNEPNLRTP